MTNIEARRIVTEEPWRWREVFNCAADLMHVQAPSVYKTVVHNAVAAANLVRELVPLTSDDSFQECLDLTPAGQPSARDLLSLYVRALRLAHGEDAGAHCRKIEGAAPWGWANHSEQPEGPRSSTLEGKNRGRGWQIYCDYETVECGPTCPALPEVLVPQDFELLECSTPF